MRYKRTFVVVLIFVVISAIVTVGISLNKEITKYYPPNPISYGDFQKSPVWVFEADEDVVATPVEKEGILFVRTKNSLFAVDSASQTVKWKVDSFTRFEPSFAPFIVDSLLIVVEEKSSLAAYSTDSGQLIWRTPAIDAADHGIESVQFIAFNSRYLYVARFNLNLTAYDIQTGKVIWVRYLPWHNTSTYIAANEDYVFLGAGEKVIALDSKSGSNVWGKDILGFVGPILLAEETLYVVDEKSASLLSFDISSRKENWNNSYRSTIDTFSFSCILEGENNLLIAANKLMMVSKADGKKIWSTDDLGFLECPIVIGDEIYIRNTDTTLYLIDKRTGLEMGSLLIQMNTLNKRDFFRGPVAVNGLLAVPFGDERLLFYEP